MKYILKFSIVLIFSFILIQCQTSRHSQIKKEIVKSYSVKSLNKEEFDEIVSATIGNSEMSKVLQAMYQSGTPKDYADALINAEVQSVLSKREKITPEKIEEGMKLLLEDKTVA